MSTPNEDESAAELLARVMAQPVPERSATVARLLRERGLADETGKLLPGSSLQGSLRKLLGKPTDNQLGMLRSGFKNHGLLIQRGDTIRVLLSTEKEGSAPGSTPSSKAAAEPTEKPTVRKPPAAKKTTAKKARPPATKATSRRNRAAPQGTSTPPPPAPETTDDDLPLEVADDAEQTDVPSSPGQALIERLSRRAQEAHSQATFVDMVLELVTGMEVDPDELPRTVERMVGVLKKVDADNTLPQLVEILQGILQDLQADEN